jgi:hypothetical protein
MCATSRTKAIGQSNNINTIDNKQNQYISFSIEFIYFSYYSSFGLIFDNFLGLKNEIQKQKADHEGEDGSRENGIIHIPKVPSIIYH